MSRIKHRVLLLAAAFLCATITVSGADFAKKIMDGWRMSINRAFEAAKPGSSLFLLPPPPASTSISVRVNASSDDAEQSLSSGAVTTNSTDLELAVDGSTSQLVGMRFNTVNVPKGATITSAYVEFETDATWSSACSLTIQGQAADNPTTFTTSSNNLSSRSKTTASVAWSPSAWSTVNEKHQTPNLKTIVQEIVNRSGWNSGNSMVMFVQGTGTREAESYDGESTAAPLLVINYALVETCGNGIDDDGDGLIDDADPDCGTFCPTGSLTLERWLGISGSAVSDLTGNANYPNSPSETASLTSFDGPDNYADNYGTRVRGYITPTQTGTYSFNLTSDDYSELYLSTDASSTNKVLISSVSGYTNTTEYTKYSSQTSSNIDLVAGQNYYVELLHKEGGGGDHFQVYWKTPSSSSWTIIPGSNLRPLACSEVCGNGIDDDGDGLIDSADKDCGSFCATGNLSLQRWTGISGTTVSNLTSNANYPNSPSVTSDLSSFDGPNDIADNYGTRVRGYIVPTITGNYTFNITADDGCYLYLGSSADAISKTRIAYIDDWTNDTEYTKYSSQTSTVKYLVAGKKYYVELLHKEGTGGDHFQVYWKTPSNSSWTIIPGGNLIPFLCQEICGNGVDDDGDGLTDGADPDCPEFWLEAECAIVGSNWNIVTDATASNGNYTTIQSGLNSTSSAPTAAADRIRFTITVSVAGNYKIFGRIKAPNGSDDSFWVRANNGTWYQWNNLATATSWTWKQVHDSGNSDTPVLFNLVAGSNTIDIAYREDGTLLDKLYVTLSGSSPSGSGNTATNCLVEICENSLDDDNDGSVDENDPDCYECTGGLLLNADFSSGLTNWVDWGNSSIYTESNGNQYAQITGGQGGFGQTVSGTVGMTYTLKFNAMKTDSEGAWGGFAFYDATWVKIGSDNAVEITSNTFQQYTVSATAPINTVYIIAFAWKNSGTGTAYLDGYCLTNTLVEICDNGIDDDGDGQIDAADSDCGCSSGSSVSNIAIGKTVVQSSTYPGGVASRAVDGNTSGVWGNNSVTHTNYESRPWWLLDLGNVEEIKNIRIWNRTDCCSDRLSNFYVFVSDNPFASVDPNVTINQSGVWSTFVTDYPNPSVVVSPMRSGRYVAIQLSGTNYLSLAEVEVIGCEHVEICDNNMDDDGDGFTDYTDFDCSTEDCTDVPGQNNITGTVFFDQNSNQIYEEGEDVGVGVAVNLYKDNDHDGKISNGDIQIQTTVTDIGGSYSFSLTPNYTLTYNGSISDGCNDAKDDNNGENRLELGKDKDIGIRFDEINIPAGSTIVSAYLYFTAKSNNSNSGSVNIYGENVLKPVDFCSNKDVNSRARTTASASWTFSNWTSNIEYQSVDIKNVIQELVNDHGTYTDGKMAMILISNGSNNLEAKSYETTDGEVGVPRLVINYSGGEVDYIVDIDETTLPGDTELTTNGQIPINLTSLGYANCDNDFGYNDAEICNNGVDDNGNGLIDCDDPSCHKDLTVTALGAATTCNAYVNISADPENGTAPYTYSWSHSLGSASSYNVNPSSTTTYSVTVTDANGCTAEDQVSITIDCSDPCAINSTDPYLDGQPNAVELIPTGSFIINMGVQPQTVANGLKPYGLVWELLHEERIPIKWAINSNKAKDGVDFTYNGADFKGGPFIVLAEYRTPAVDAIIADWISQGVIGVNTTSDFMAPIDRTINYSMNWTLDQQNGSIAEEYLENAGIPNTAYNWVLPNDLDCCNDVFVMPHAEPEWATHSHLLDWNDCLGDGGCGGAIWAGCKAVSELENIYNPADPSERMNFLMLDPISPVTNPAVWSGDHDDGSLSYQHKHHDHPVMQFMGLTNGAQEGGAEQVYLPTNGWRPGTLIGIEDIAQENIPSESPGPAAKLAFGYAFGDPHRGYVTYEAGHNVGGTNQENIAAQRAFLNFSFMAVYNKAIKPVTSVPTVMQSGEVYNLSAIATGGSGNYYFAWSSDCGGNFIDGNTANATFIAPQVSVTTTCQIHLTVTDDCGSRTSFESITIEINPIFPEICDNGVDDDSDGLIDENDPDCYNPGVCSHVPGQNDINGSVYLDVDEDQKFEAGDSGQSGVTLNLYEDNNANGVLDAGDNYIESTVSDVDGTYNFVVNPVFIATYDGTIQNGCEDGRDGNNSENKLQFGKDKQIGLRYTGINIPAGATITYASLYFVANTSSNKSGIVNIYANDVAAPVNFCTNNDVDQRIRTSNVTAWSFGNWVAGSTYQSTNFKSVIQELVDSYGGFNNGQISLLMISTGTDNMEAKSYETNNNGTQTPRLVINYRLNNTARYIVEIDESTLPPYTELTTPSTQTAVFNLSGLGDCYNDFGFEVTDEICDNGIDDDGDGLTDCADPDCGMPSISNVSISHPDNCPLLDDGQITITASGSNLEYSIDNGANYQSFNYFSDLVPGSYDVLVRNTVTGCVYNYPSNPVVLTEITCVEICDNGVDDDGDGLTDCNDPDCPNPSIASVTFSHPNNCPILNNGQITVTATGSNLEYSINNGVTYQMSNIFTGLSAGTYTVRVRNSNSGCFENYATNPVTLTDPVCTEICNNGIDDDGDGLTDCNDPDCGPGVFAGSDQSICVGTSTLLSATGSNGTSPYTYFWDNGLGAGKTHTVTPLTSTVYNVTLTDASGCTSTDQVSITTTPCTEICTDGVDNDGDGLVDCDDPECIAVGQPRPVWDSYTTCPGASYREQVIFNDDNLQSPIFSIYDTPDFGTVSIDNNGVFIYTPFSSSCGLDQFIYQVCNQTSGCCDTASVFLTIGDNVPPQLKNVPSDITINCDESVPNAPGFVYAVDDCPGIYVSFEETTSDNVGACQNHYIYRKWTATDLCGNTADMVQTITVVDDSPPEVFRVYTLANGKKIIAGIAKKVTHEWRHINFPIDFDSAPIVFTQVVTENEASAVTVRQKDVITEGFQLRLQEEQGSNGIHAYENVAWIAVEAGADSGNGNLQVDLIQNVSNSEKLWNFSTPFTETPALIFTTQTYNDADPIGIRFNNLTPSSVKLYLEEEKSTDAEVIHGNEDVGVLAINAGNIWDVDNTFVGESGSIQINKNVTTVDLSRQYTKPVVVLGGVEAGGDPTLIRVTNVTSNSFDVKLEEWDYLDGNHNKNLVSYIVIEGSIPGDLEFYCDQNAVELIPQINMFATDNCDNQIEFIYADSSQFTELGLQVNRTWTALDDCGNTTVIKRTETCMLAALRLKTMLYGPLINNTSLNVMKDDLRQKGYLPLTEPYSDNGNYLHVADGGGETTDQALLDVTGNNAIVDWVFVEIRDQADGVTILDTKSALLQRDGDVVTSTGGSILFFPSLPEGLYYVSVKHRNHLGLMTFGTEYLTTNDPPMIDFTSSSLQTRGGNVAGHMHANGIRTQWSGDLNGDRRVIYQGPLNDVFHLFSHVLSAYENTDYLANYISHGYHNEDLNMDGKAIFQGPTNDKAPMIYHTILAHPDNQSVLANYIVTPGLP